MFASSAVAATAPAPVWHELDRRVWVAGGFFEGEIGGTPIQMNLSYPAPTKRYKDGAVLLFTSEYWYPRLLTNQRLDIELITDPADTTKVTLKAHDRFSTKTASSYSETFLGHWQDSKHTELRGTWSNSVNGSPLPFHLNLRIAYQGESLSFATAKADSEHTGRRSYHTSVYPIFTDPTLAASTPSLGLVKMQQPLDQLALAERIDSDAEEQDGLVIQWASRDYLFLRRTNISEPFKAPHAYIDDSYAHYKRTEQGFVPVDLSEFYADTPQCKQKLTKLILDAGERAYAAGVDPEATASPRKIAGNHPDSLYRNEKGLSDFLVTPLGIAFESTRATLGNYRLFARKKDMGSCAKSFPEYLR